MGKKKCSLIFICLLAAVLCSACGKTSESYSGYAKADYTKITLYSDVSFWEPPLWDTTEGTVTGDISAKTGVTVDVEVPTQEADTRLKLKIIDDELPDVMAVTDETTINQLITSGKVFRMDEFFETYKPDSHILKQFPEDVKKELIKRDGAWYVLPSHINSKDARNIWKPCIDYWNDVAEYSDNNTIIWNKHLLGQLGIREEELDTEEGVLAAFEKAKNSGITVDGKDIIPLILDGKAYQDPSLKYLEGTFGAEWVDENGNYKDIILQPETKEALKFIHTALQKGYLTAESLTLENMQVKELIASGRLLCFIGNAANTSASEEDWFLTSAIISSENKTPVLGIEMEASTGWMQILISKDCKSPRKIADWIDYMTSEEGMQLCFFGHEGEDYTIDEKGMIHRTEKRKDAEANYSSTGIGAWWLFENLAWRRSVSPADEEYGNIQLAYGSDPRTVRYDLSLLMFPADLIAADSEEGKIEQEIKTFKEKQILVTVLAETDEQFETEYKKLIDGLYERGIEDIDALKNEAYQKNCEDYQTSIQKVN